jgi:hypothetical protein
LQRIQSNLGASWISTNQNSGGINWHPVYQLDAIIQYLLCPLHSGGMSQQNAEASVLLTNVFCNFVVYCSHPDKKQSQQVNMIIPLKIFLAVKKNIRPQQKNYMLKNMKSP